MGTKTKRIIALFEGEQTSETGGGTQNNRREKKLGCDLYHILSDGGGSCPPGNEHETRKRRNGPFGRGGSSDFDSQAEGGGLEYSGNPRSGGRNGDRAWIGGRTASRILRKGKRWSTITREGPEVEEGGSTSKSHITGGGGRGALFFFSPGALWIQLGQRSEAKVNSPMFPLRFRKRCK